MLPQRWRPLGTVIGTVLAVTACTTAIPTASPSLVPAATSTPRPTAEPTATADPTPTPTPTPSPSTVEVPLAVVTAFTDLRTEITLAEVDQAATSGGLMVPCGWDEISIPNTGDRDCAEADLIAGSLAAEPGSLGLLPPGLVEPKAKVLKVEGADLFGNAAQRALPYPITATSSAWPEEWTAHDPAQIRTLVSVGESCPDRGVAHQSITLGKGWEYVFGGGTAQYTAVYPNPVGPGLVGDGFNIVDAVPTGNEGAVWDFIGAADITVEDFECPVINAWTVNQGVNFSIDPRVLGFMAEGGTDVVTLASNHLTDRGIDGFLETLAHFDAAGIARTGAGADLNEALDPAVVDVNGLRFAVVGWNIVPGAVEAGPGQPGVAWMREPSVRESVARAAAAGDVVICMPQWGYPEYRVEFTAEELAWQQIMLDAGCDQILGHGTHWASQIDFTRDEAGELHYTVLSHGNFLFGQSWSQQTQEGVLHELTFRGTELVQARMHPYIMLEQAVASFTNPQTDGAYVLNRVFDGSDESY